MGRKRFRSTPTLEHNKHKNEWCDNGDYKLEDRISGLPDEILVSILSLLTIKEAGVTSVLSSRWRHLWALTGCLNFDAAEALENVRWEPDLLMEERRRYARWVNRVVGLHKASTIEEFRICSGLGKSYKCTIDKWLKFALARQVQRLELKMTHYVPKYYTFPYELVAGFKSLKALRLSYVNVGDEVVDCFLSDCPLLELLSISVSRQLVHLKIAGTSLMLKYLEIRCCNGIKSIEICDINLVSIKYIGSKISFLVENVPALVELYIGGQISGFLNEVFPRLSCCLPQLENLRLGPNYCGDSAAIKEFLVVPELTNLKKLILDVWAIDGDSLLGFTSFIKAFPYLQKLVFQTTWWSPMLTERKVKKAVKCPHHYLKEVKLTGYYGHTSDLELVMYFLENAVALEKLIIDPRNSVEMQTTGKVKDSKKEQDARSRAKQQLEGKAPTGVKLVIL